MKQSQEKPHAPMESELPGEAIPFDPYKCKQCDLPIVGETIEYAINSNILCHSCFKEISKYMDSKMRTYNDFSEVEDKYPKIFEKDFYKRPDIRKLLNLD